jgi:hypothetical protein
MKVRERYEVPTNKLNEFLSDHIDETIIIKKVTPLEIHFSIEQEYTEPELHMFHLRKFVESGDATPEEQNAAEYAIGAIKTLMDMGVIK